MTPEQPIDREKIERVQRYLDEQHFDSALAGRTTWLKSRKDCLDLAQWYLNGARTMCLAQQFDTRDFVRTNQEGHV